MATNERNPNDNQLERLRQAIMQKMEEVRREQMSRRVKTGIAESKAYKKLFGSTPD